MIEKSSSAKTLERPNEAICLISVTILTESVMATDGAPDVLLTQGVTIKIAFPAVTPFNVTAFVVGQVTPNAVTLNGVTAGNAILIVTPCVNNTSGAPSVAITDSVNIVTDIKQIASFGLSSVFSLLDFSIIRSASAGSHTLTAT